MKKKEEMGCNGGGDVIHAIVVNYPMSGFLLSVQ